MALDASIHDRRRRKWRQQDLNGTPMNATSDPPPLVDVDGMPLVIPRHLLSHFAEAAAQIQRFYGLNPDVPILVRLWLASTSPLLIRREFESAVLGITKAGFEFEHDGDSDGDDNV